MIVNYLNYMIMADIDKINDFIQSTYVFITIEQPKLIRNIRV